MDRRDDARYSEDYIKQMNLNAIQVWLRYRSKMTVRVEANGLQTLRQKIMTLAPKISAEMINIYFDTHSKRENSSASRYAFSNIRKGEIKI